ncbi:hypothetical protein [Allorhodopirellula solitaria]|uniref:hypothetical protein n=1 Tax=Allorhodopirellula solitaria TaxID=2527987 RepID=UPI0016450802|nr:hypothetical protein [Allorhodopirellula solitaria]
MRPLALVALGLAALTLWGLQVVRSGWCNDEAAHIPAGLYHLETGRMDAYRVNPPLPRMIAAIPLLLDRPEIDWHYSESRYVRNEYQFAHQWVRDNHEHLRRYLLWTRGTMAGFFLLGLWVVSKWSSQLYGGCAGWVAAMLWTFNPDIIANSAVVAPDLPATASGLLAGYVFWSWLIQRERPFPWAVAAAVAFAVLCKFSWLFLLVGLPLLTLVHDAFFKRESAGERLRWLGSAPIARRVAVAAFDSLRLLLSFSLTVLLINWCYGFDGSGTRLGHFEFISESLSGRDIVSGQTANRFAGGWFAWVPVPLPAEMVYGLDYLKWEFEQGMPCYLRGKWQHGGWWYFHLYAMAVKMPIGYWLLITAGLGSLALDWLRRGKRFSLEWLPLLIAIVFVALVSFQTGFTHHVRYVLPAYGFLFIVASRVAVVLPGRFAIGLAAICLSGTLWFHATHLGLAHTFFNPLAGGPDNGWRHLSHSNVDWGQSTYRMVDWVKKHPEQRPMTVLFRSSLGNPEALLKDEPDVFTSVGWHYPPGIRNPVPRQPGWYLISGFPVTLQSNRFFWDKTPAQQPDPDSLLYRVESTLDTPHSQD